MNIPFPPVPKVHDPNLQAYLEHQRMLLLHWLKQTSIDIEQNHEELDGLLGGDDTDGHWHLTETEYTGLVGLLSPVGTPGGWQFNATANSSHAMLTWD